MSGVVVFRERPSALSFLVMSLRGIWNALRHWHLELELTRQHKCTGLGKVSHKILATHSVHPVWLHQGSISLHLMILWGHCRKQSPFTNGMTGKINILALQGRQRTGNTWDKANWLYCFTFAFDNRKALFNYIATHKLDYLPLFLALLGSSLASAQIHLCSLTPNLNCTPKNGGRK